MFYPLNTYGCDCSIHSDMKGKYESVKMALFECVSMMRKKYNNGARHARIDICNDSAVGVASVTLSNANIVICANGNRRIIEI